MTYFNFTKITPAAPNDPFVNEVTQINNNWDEIDNKLTQQSNGTPPVPDTGQEWISGGRFLAWNGTAVRNPDDIDSGWSSWFALTLSANVVVRPGFTPRWRNNSIIRRVELDGGIQKDAGASVWPAGTLQTITAPGTFNIVSGFAPIGGLTYQSSAAALPSGGNQASSGWHTIDVNTGIVRIQTSYVGGSGGGNFIMLDGIEWWY